MDIKAVLAVKWVIPGVTGVGGLAAGIGVGYILGKRKASFALIEFEDGPVEGDDSDSEEVEFQHFTEEELEQLRRVEAHLRSNESQPRKVEVVEEEVVTEEYTLSETQSVNVFAANRTDVWDEEAEIIGRVVGQPYVIPVEEFLENDNEYRQTTVTYYAGDDIVADETDTPVYNHAALMGELKFGHGSNDANVVYIRNDRHKIEWEVLRHSSSFETEVSGLVIEHNYEEADLKHSNDRKFRTD